MGNTVSGFCNDVVEFGNKLAEFFIKVTKSVDNYLKDIKHHLKNLFTSGNKSKHKEIAEVCTKLKNAEKKLTLMREELESLAAETISNVDLLEQVLNSLEEAASEDRINEVTSYAATRMINLVDRSMGVLEEFKEKYSSMDTEMSALRTDLDGLSWKMKGEQKNSINELVLKVKSTEYYISDEIGLLTTWKRRLHEMQPEFESKEEFTISIEVNKNGVLDMLANLRRSCDEYIKTEFSN